jgi:hypothetical protein
MEGELVAHRFLHTAKLCWWIELDAEATLAMVEVSTRIDRAYVLLHESGSLMHDERGPILAATWPEVCEHARVNSARWALSLTDRRAIRLTHGKTGVYADGTSVLLVPNKKALESLTIDNTTTQEIEREEATAKTSRRPSGAENRRRRVRR